MTVIFISSTVCFIYYRSLLALAACPCVFCSVIYLFTFLATLFYLYGSTLSDTKDIYTTYFKTDADNHFWVAECDGEIAGTIAIVKKENSFCQKTGKVAWLRRMAVRKKFRRLGIAQKLVQTTIAFCKDHSYEVIELITTEVHKPARNLYLNMGFVQVNYKPYQYLYGFIKIWTYEFEYIL